VTSPSPIVLITGGSRGIGAATARLAAARGYVVAFTYLERAVAAHALVDEITSSGGTALAIQADVSVEADVLRVFGEVDSRLGTLAALVISLMISTANTAFSARTNAITTLAIDIVKLNRVLVRYGPDAASIRDELRKRQ